jgi:hypothetical protein
LNQLSNLISPYNARLYVININTILLIKAIHFIIYISKCVYGEERFHIIGNAGSSENEPIGEMTLHPDQRARMI